VVAMGLVAADQGAVQCFSVEMPLCTGRKYDQVAFSGPSRPYTLAGA